MIGGTLHSLVLYGLQSIFPGTIYLLLSLYQPCDTGKADSCYCHFMGKLPSSHPLFLNMSHLVHFQEALTQHLPYPPHSALDYIFFRDLDYISFYDSCYYH